ncbi:MAG: IS481 family transposase [Candidatus Latescibacteria bacterium]|nr:IS481 family transposase [Candidatus Latescibacterota bacterium]NIO55411.1 IS481 family transposase [Candidatus Latescibacterota bacterium]
MKKELAEALVIRRKMFIVLYARDARNIRKACQEAGVPRSTFYRWKKAFEKDGVEGLMRKKPIAKSHPRQLPPEVVEKILHLRHTYHLGPQRITWYLERYHGVETSCSSVYRTLVRHGLRRLPRKVGRRAIHTRRYAKQVPGHHIQVDVKFLTLKTAGGRKIRRFQYTAVDDATRVRALKIYKRHNQKSAINFVDYVIEKFPFRIHTIRTDRGHEFQAHFHWHVEDKGIRHVYIKPRTPQLNGKVERSHRSDQEEFYQLLTYTNDVDLNKKLAEWENFYNYNRPHGAFNGKAPYEALRSMLR